MTREEIQAHGRGRIEGYRIPRQLTLVDAIGHSPAGKLDDRSAQKLADSAPA